MQHGRQPRPTSSLLLLGTLIVFPCLNLVDAAWGQQGQRSMGFGRPGAGHLTTQTHRPAHRPPRLSGFGSAANISPRTYQRLYGSSFNTRFGTRFHGGAHHGTSRHGTPHHGGGHHGPGVVTPVIVLYDPLSYAVEPPPPEPQQPSVIVVQAPPPVVAPTPFPAPVLPAAPPPPAPAPEPRSTEPGEVRFSIEPGDAEVYLNDDYLGTGSELATLETSQPFPPGVYVLEVVHHEHRSQRLVFGVQPDEPMHVLVDLLTERRGSRSRIR